MRREELARLDCAGSAKRVVGAGAGQAAVGLEGVAFVFAWQGGRRDVRQRSRLTGSGVLAGRFADCLVGGVPAAGIPKHGAGQGNRTHCTRRIQVAARQQDGKTEGSGCSGGVALPLVGSGIVSPKAEEPPGKVGAPSKRRRAPGQTGVTCRRTATRRRRRQS